MITVRVLVAVALLAVAVAVGYFVFAGRNVAGVYRTIYYATTGDQALRSFQVSETAGDDVRSRAFFVAEHTIAGPPASIADAVRFPAGTHVLHLDVTDSEARVDLSRAVEATEGTIGETGEFKALVWSLTDLEGISAVRVTVAGRTLATLPGGHLELDEPLTRANW